MKRGEIKIGTLITKVDSIDVRTMEGSVAGNSRRSETLTLNGAKDFLRIETRKGILEALASVPVSRYKRSVKQGVT